MESIKNQKITDEMIEAGAIQLSEHGVRLELELGGTDALELVRDVYQAMNAVRGRAPAPRE